MAAKKSRGTGSEEHAHRSRLELAEAGSVYKRGPRRIKRGIADADKIARTGSKDEPVRDAPPAGAWNDTSAD